MPSFKVTSKDGREHDILFDEIDRPIVESVEVHEWKITRNEKNRISSKQAYSAPYHTRGTSSPTYLNRLIMGQNDKPGTRRVYRRNGYTDMRRDSLYLAKITPMRQERETKPEKKLRDEALGGAIERQLLPPYIESVKGSNVEEVWIYPEETKVWIAAARVNGKRVEIIRDSDRQKVQVELGCFLESLK